VASKKTKKTKMSFSNAFRKTIQQQKNLLFSTKVRVYCAQTLPEMSSGNRFLSVLINLLDKLKMMTERVFRPSFSLSTIHFLYFFTGNWGFIKPFFDFSQ
jgi:hypothetical protein